jgi:hypothetical protein
MEEGIDSVDTGFRNCLVAQRRPEQQQKKRETKDNWMIYNPHVSLFTSRQEQKVASKRVQKGKPNSNQTTENGQSLLLFKNDLISKS